MGVLPSAAGDLGQPDQRLDRLDLAKKGLLIAELVAPPVFEKTLCCRRNAPVGSARQAAPGVDMTADFIDDRAVALGFKG
jgi:hypothetical protein